MEVKDVLIAMVDAAAEGDRRTLAGLRDVAGDLSAPHEDGLGEPGGPHAERVKARMLAVLRKRPSGEALEAVRKDRRGHTYCTDDTTGHRIKCGPGEQKKGRYAGHSAEQVAQHIQKIRGELTHERVVEAARMLASLPVSELRKVNKALGTKAGSAKRHRDLMDRIAERALGAKPERPDPKPAGDGATPPPKAAEPPADGSNVKPVELTREEIRKLLAEPGDRYKDAGLQRTEVKGQTRHSGDTIYGYPYSPQHFAKSHATGRPIRHYVKLPDGQVVHPDELRDAIKRGRVKIKATPQETEKAERNKDWREAIKAAHLHTRQALTDKANAAGVDTKERAEVTREHKADVEMALSRGDYVPAEVLADYPDLQNAKPERPSAPSAKFPPDDQVRGWHEDQERRFNEVRSEHDSYLKSLPADQRKAVRQYTQQDYYKELNEVLRGGEDLYGDQPRIVKGLDAAIAGAPPFAEPVTTYRGLQFYGAALGDFERQMAAAIESGDPVEAPAYSSTSMAPDAAQTGFAQSHGNVGGVMLEIVARQGLCVDPVSEADEQEILLPRGARFRVAARKEVPFAGGGGKKTTVYQMEQLP